METKRQQKINRLIQKELGNLFQLQLKEITGKTFVTVTSVSTSADLGLSKVFLSLMICDDSPAFIANVNDNTKKIRGILGNLVRNQLRVIPELTFFLDDTAEAAAQIDSLISGLDIPDEDKLDDGDYKKLD